mmetsp:Transcript_110730/g.313268  ORF Transcript_110730/g.313268 Transcript_110730/m.313268 type:complete len:204 (+) Transcript_110730:1792-2403(+)
MPSCMPCDPTPCMPCMLPAMRGTFTRSAKTRAVQIAKVMRERPTTEGTKTCASRSAVRWTWALLARASRTMWHIWPSMVSQPTFVTRIRQPPVMHVVPPNRRSPWFLMTGMLSPVRRLSSTWMEASEHIVPSRAILPPAYTRRMSPSCTSSAGTVDSSESPQRIAEVGWLEGRSDRASMPLSFARASRNLPVITTVMRMGPMA